MPAVPRVRPSGLAVAGVLALAGLLLAASARTARGTDLRDDAGDLVVVVQQGTARVQRQQAQVLSLRQRVDALTRVTATADAGVAVIAARASALAAAAGVVAVTGPGVVVTLDDAPPGNAATSGAAPDDLVVHQQDVQAVVNAMWAGGAEAMGLQDQRVVSTSAVRCVGNTLILQGRVYSPPYRVSAIGNVPGMRHALAASPEVSVYRQFVQAYGLGYAEEERDSMSLPAFAGPLDLRSAAVPGR